MIVELIKMDNDHPGWHRVGFETVNEVADSLGALASSRVTHNSDGQRPLDLLLRQHYDKHERNEAHTDNEKLLDYDESAQLVGILCMAGMDTAIKTAKQSRDYTALAIARNARSLHESFDDALYQAKIVSGELLRAKDMHDKRGGKFEFPVSQGVMSVGDMRREGEAIVRVRTSTIVTPYVLARTVVVRPDWELREKPYLPGSIAIPEPAVTDKVS